MNKRTITANIRKLTKLSEDLGKLAFASHTQNEAARLYATSHYCDLAIAELRGFYEPKAF